MSEEGEKKFKNLKNVIQIINVNNPSCGCRSQLRGLWTQQHALSRGDTAGPEQIPSILRRNPTGTNIPTFFCVLPSNCCSHVEKKNPKTLKCWVLPRCRSWRCREEPSQAGWAELSRAELSWSEVSCCAAIRKQKPVETDLKSAVRTSREECFL